MTLVIFFYNNFYDLFNNMLFHCQLVSFLSVFTEPSGKANKILIGSWRPLCVQDKQESEKENEGGLFTLLLCIMIF